MAEERGSPERTWPPEVRTAFLEEAAVGICAVRDGRVLYANRWLREAAGLRTESGEPVDLLAFVHPHDRAQLAEQLRLTLAGEATGPAAALRLLTDGGVAREVELHCRRIDTGAGPAVLGTFIDASAKLEVERTLQSHVERLEKSDRRRQLFADILSHDLMSPVWVAENYLRFLSEEKVSEERRPMYEGMRTALGKARGILVDARTYLSLQCNPGVVPEPTDLAAVAQEAVNLTLPSSACKRQTVTLEAAGPVLVAGTGLLRDLVLHLLSNAVAYGPPGSAIDVVVASGSRARLEVRDRGPGVPENQREQIFARFERREKGAISGVGLGLAIVRDIARLHNAEVWVEENPGGGSIFVAEFPAAEPKDQVL